MSSNSSAQLGEPSTDLLLDVSPGYPEDNLQECCVDCEFFLLTKQTLTFKLQSQAHSPRLFDLISLVFVYTETWSDIFDS